MPLDTDLITNVTVKIDVIFGDDGAKPTYGAIKAAINEAAYKAAIDAELDAAGITGDKHVSASLAVS